MSVIDFPKVLNSVVTCVSVQVSEYSAANGGADRGTLYVVEVLFLDGKWEMTSHHRDLAEAWCEAGYEAVKRKALLLPQSMWPSRQITA